MLRINYRPISLLPIFNILLEKLVYSRLDLNTLRYIRLSSKTLHHAYTQFLLSIKFKKLLKVTTILWEFFWTWRKPSTPAVDHKILLIKIRILWYRRYSQCFVCIIFIKPKTKNKFFSIGDTNSFYCGVPQGSVFEPLLFLEYINDFESNSLRDMTNESFYRK